MLGLVGVSVGCWVRSVRLRTERLSLKVDALIADTAGGRPGEADGENAAPLYLEAHGLYVEPAHEGLKVFGGFQDVPPEAVEKYVADNAAYLAAVRRAAAMPRCTLPVDEFTRKSIFLPAVLMRFGPAGKCLAAAAVVEARAGRTGEAVETLLLILRVSSHHRHRQFHLISIQSGCERRLASALDIVLNSSDCTPAEVRKLLAALAEHGRVRLDAADEYRARKLATLVWIEAYARGHMGFFDELGLGEVHPPILGNEFLHGAARLSGAFVMEADYMEGVYDEAARIASRPYWQAAGEMQALEGRTFERLPPYVLASRAMMPMMSPPNVLPPILGRWVAGSARLETARAGLGCRLFRLSKGTYPATLEEMVKGLPSYFATEPLDPMKGSKLGYARTPGGCRLWSVGGDLADDDGRPRQGRDPKGDIVFELKR